MTDQSSPSPGTEQPQAGRRRGRRWLLIVTVALAAAFTGGLATRAVSQYGFGPGYWHMRGPLTPAQIEERVDRVIRHAAIELDATAEQQDKVRAIAKAAVKDLLPMREKAQAARQRATALLTGPTVDRSAIEAFRAEQIALADTASRRIAQALGDVADVLTPEQRRKVDEFVQWRKGYWRSWHRG